jgi:hypothetical protein
MVFAYRHTGQTAQELLDKEEWSHLRTILRGFRDAAVGSGVLPVVLFIPTKFEVYAHLVSEGSGRKILEEAREGPSDAAGALQIIAADLDIPFIDLLPDFRMRAEAGDLLYYPFDTHWNSAGRRVAAQKIAGWLDQVGACARPQLTGRDTAPFKETAAKRDSSPF